MSASRQRVPLSPNRPPLSWLPEGSVSNCLDAHALSCVHDSCVIRRIEALESKVKELMSDRATSSVEVSGYPSETSTRCELVTEHNGGGHEKIKEDVVTQGFLNMELAESYVTAFKSVMTPHFPFVVIGSDVTAAQLRKERPFLFLTVLASAAYENMPLQRSLGLEVKKAVASRMVIHGEISFDMLQGLLVYLAWYTS